MTRPYRNIIWHDDNWCFSSLTDIIWLTELYGSLVIYNYLKVKVSVFDISSCESTLLFTLSGFIYECCTYLLTYWAVCWTRHLNSTRHCLLWPSACLTYGRFIPRCEDEFMQDRDAAFERIRQLKDLTPEERDEKELLLKRGYTGHMRFIGEIYLLNLVKSKIMYYCIGK